MAQASVSNKAAQLREAMKGMGTNDDKLVEIVGNLDTKDIQPLLNSYAKDISRDLVKDIKDETSGSFEDALVALLTPLIQYDAKCLRKAMEGVGTDEQVLTDIICTRTPQELAEITAAFKHLFEHDLAEDVRSEVRGDYKRVLVQRLTAKEDAKQDVDNDVEKLYKAGQGKIGTDEAVFISILTTRSRDHLQKINVAYSNKHGKSLAAVIDSEIGGELKKALIALVTPVDEYYAERLHACMAGAGTDDKTLIRLIAGNRAPRALKQIAMAYLKKYNKSLKAAVENEASGDYKKLLLAVLKHYVE